MKRNIMSPFFVVNPKAYLYGEEALALALKADELAQIYNLDIFFTVQYADAYRIKEKTKRLIITAQHMDSLLPGRGMGYILPEGLVANGVEATFLNHAEYPLTADELTAVLKRADDLNILTIVCADSLSEAQEIAKLEPDIMICEPTELIGSGETSSLDYIKQTNDSIKLENPNIKVLQAAGISSPADVSKALESGADATGGTSGIVLADDPFKMLEEMTVAVDNFKRGR